MNRKNILLIILSIVLSKTSFGQCAIDTIANNKEINSLIAKNYKKKIRKKIMQEDRPVLLIDTNQVISAYKFIGGKDFFPLNFSDSIKKLWSEKERLDKYSIYSDKCPGLFCFFSAVIEGYQLAEIFLVTDKSKYYRGYNCSFISKSIRIQILLYNDRIIKVMLINNPNKCFLY